MNRVQHLHRIVVLCYHVARNLAYYHAGWRGSKPICDTQLWATTNGNCDDICVPEWCKLFGEPQGEHHWSQVVFDIGNFEVGLYHTVKIDAATFETFRVAMRDYRDKFIAHLDRGLAANLPAHLGRYYDIAAAEAAHVYKS